MANYTPLRNLAPEHGYQPGDCLVLFGELFSRGYANGLVDEAKNAGMTILGITVGRRAEGGALRPLTPEELAEAEANLGGKIINIPLWAGFDMDPAADGSTPTDQLAGIKSDEWEQTKLDWTKISQSKAAGTARFRSACQQAMAQLDPLIPNGKKVLFAHTMAGGIPKAKIVLFLTNRVVKGKGDKFIPSAQMWASDLGKLMQENFQVVTAETLGELIQASSAIRSRVEASGGQASYTAYGYHGTEILLNGKWQWQTYNPYLQGQAKILLEQRAAEAWKQGVKVTVFNCPEIRTNSSDLFAGVELSLYPLVTALEQASQAPWVQQLKQDLGAMLKPEHSLNQLLTEVNAYHCHPVPQGFYADFAAWPRHNSAELAELMLTASDAIMAMNQDRKKVVTDLLSEVVVQSTGHLMINEAFRPSQPVTWIGHDVIAQERRTRLG